MALSKPIQIAAIGVLIASLAALLLSLVQLPPYIDPAVHKDIGRAIARETLTLRKPGAPIIVIKRDTAAFPQPAADYQFKAFKKELARAKVEIASVQEVQLDPLKPVEVPPGDFLNLVRKAPADSVIVSFMGPPIFSDEQKSTLKTIKPEIFAFCSGNVTERVNVPRLFEEHLLHAAVVSRSSGNSGAATETEFGRLYVTLNGNNIASLKGALAYVPQN